jgi:long-chain acyl-CoA synthetase
VEVHTFASPLERALRVALETCAVVCEDRRRTYAELGQRCRRLAGALRDLGLQKGDRVAVHALNSDQYLELFLAVPAAGLVLVPINSRLAQPEVQAIFEDSGAHVLFSDQDSAGLEADLERVVRIPDGYETLIEAAHEVAIGDGVDEDDLAALFYTSGTTGAAKGAMHSHRGLLASGQNFMATWPFGPDTRWIICSPMFHTGGILAVLATVWHGGTHVILPAFKPDLALDVIERERVTHTLMVPTMLAAAAEAQLAQPRDVSSLRYLSHGASPIAAETLRRAHRAFPDAELLHVYGTTETTPITTLMRYEERVLDAAEVKSCGQPAVGVDVRILDANAQETPPGVVGEVVVRGPSVMLGYWKKPLETAEVLHDGSYWSGDLGYRDRHSNIFLVDRAKDMIVTGGENVYCAEVESALYDHPDVLEAVVFGIPDHRWGEAVHAVVVLREQDFPRDQELSSDALIAHCRERIASYKVPKGIEIREQSLPKSAAGKVLKRELREPFWAARETKVGAS